MLHRSFLPISGVVSLALIFSVPLMARAADRDFSVFNLGKSKALNPDISVNFLGHWQRGTGLSDSQTVPNRNGLTLQELEFHFSADVDPYLRAVALVAAAQEDGSTGYGFDPEEVFLETISLPRITLKAGKFYTSFGKHNQLHRHAFPFIDAPLIHQKIFGDEALNDAGISASLLLPTSWYSELTTQIINGGNPSLYASPSAGRMSGVIRLKNLWDLNDDLTMELGVSGTSGKNSVSNSSSAVGSDLTFKWRPAEGGKYRSLIWSSEYIQGMNFMNDPSGTPTEIKKLGGIASWIQYQFAERWWIQGRAEYIGRPSSDLLPIQKKQSVLLAFLPSEFSGFRLQYDHLKDGSRAKDDHTVGFQFNVSIGAHPAHAY
jgi:hypothetical protein